MSTLTRTRFAIRVTATGIGCGKPWTLVLVRASGDEPLAYFGDRRRAYEFADRMNDAG